VKSIVIRPATAADLPGILGLLRDAELPADGVPEHLAHFLAAESGTELLGAIGFERYGDEALVRSAVVDKKHRGSGIGGRLYESLRQQAHALHIRRLVLLTTTAEEYFRARGFVPIARGAVNGPMAASVEFTTACPSSAVCMELML
jgi:amino-acid N-acetyltransferase